MNKIFLFITIFLLAGFHLLFLDSDPSPIKRWGDVSDEGYWIHNARLNILFNNYTKDDMEMSRFGAPLFNLLVKYVFMFLGVSYFSARLIPVISFWLILIMMYYLIKDHYGQKFSIQSVFIFGIVHEMLMYTKWATPIITEIMFLLSILFFYQNKNVNKNFCFLSGLAFSLAILSKITAVLFLPSLIIFFLWEYYFNEISLKEILLFVYGVLLILLPVSIFFIYPNFYNYQIMFDYPGYTAGNFEFFSTLKNLILIPFNFTLFKYPSTVFIFISSLFYFSDRITNIALKPNYRDISCFTTIEKFCISWILGVSISLCINGQMGYDRRMVGFFIPFFILSVFYFNTSLNIINKIKSGSNKKKIFIGFIYITIIFLSCFYLGSIYKVSLSHWFGDGNPFLENGESIFGLMKYFLPFGFYLLYLIINSKILFMKNLLLCGLMVTSTTLNLIWYTNYSYSARDSLNDVIDFKINDYYLAGNYVHWLSIHTYLKPIWYFRTYNEDDDFNRWFFEYRKDKKFFLLSVLDPPEGIRGKSLFIDIDQFKDNSLKLIKEFNLCPLPFTGVFREKLQLYEVN